MPKFTCWIPDYGHERCDGRAVKAIDAEHAARIYIEWYEARSAEYPVASGNPILIAVAASGATEEMFIVIGENRPVYYARRQHA